MGIIAGIDLGTTFSALAILNKIGRPEVVPNSEGERLTPSAVYFDEDQDATVRVGIEAVNCRQLNPERSIRWIKRHMGDSQWRKQIDNKAWTPEEISSLILKKLKQDAEIEHPGIRDVVISVPAHFDEVRRKATMDAGKMAGLNVIGIVNEPVSAALYYATTHHVSGRVLVYDLGGGTFDVTIMDVDGRNINIVCSQGDHALGGVDFDQKIVEVFERVYQEQTGQKLIHNEQERAKYEDEAEDLKKTLSRRNTAKKMLYGPAGSARVEITREDFEKLIEPLVGRTEILIDVSLQEAGCTPKEISQVLLVGGSTRIPMVQRRLTEKFGMPPLVAVNVDECVALGAAIHAGLNQLRDHPDQVEPGIAAGLKDIKLKDVCNHSYGTLCAPIDEATGKHVIRNSILLKKNTPLPCQATQTFYTMSDGQTELQVTITQGEDEDPDFVNRIATEVFDLPPDRPANRPIQVCYSYDLNQRMHCTFSDEESGRRLEVDLTLDENGQSAAKTIQQKVSEVEKYQVR
jgi:molecular chaperone DnaK